MKKWILFLLLLPLAIIAQPRLSPDAEIHVVTCGPYQGELYSAFGHSAIRVKDPDNRLDLIFNYGVFNFNQPNFYLNFAKGHLLYRLAVSDYRPFVEMYKSENRFVHEQVLNIPDSSKQQLFDFLVWNARPENMEYYYDYFYDNCATRIRDAVEKGLDGKVAFPTTYADPGYTIRELCDLYLYQQPWGDLGIDLCLGMPMDQVATTYQYMFLPDYVELAFEEARFKTADGEQPLVKETLVTYKPAEEAPRQIIFTPLLVFSLLLIVGLYLSYIGFKKSKSHLWFDLILQTIIGLLGWFLLILWLFTDHKAAADNLNILWAFPLYVPVVYLLLKKNPPAWVPRFYRVVAIVQILLLIGWLFLPQSFNTAVLPLVILLAVRAAFISHRTSYLAFFKMKVKQ